MTFAEADHLFDNMTDPPQLQPTQQAPKASAFIKCVRCYQYKQVGGMCVRGHITNCLGCNLYLEQN